MSKINLPIRETPRPVPLHVASYPVCSPWQPQASIFCNQNSPSLKGITQAFCVTSDDKNLHGIKYLFLFSKSPVTSDRHINKEKELTVSNRKRKERISSEKDSQKKASWLTKIENRRALWAKD